MAARTDWLLLINAMLGNFLAGLSARIFLISLPTVAHGLKTDVLAITWALISFQLAAISLSVVFGRLGDIFGRRTIYGMGFVTMTVGAFLCGISQNVLHLIAFRFLQGVGTAMTQSVARVLAMEAMPRGSEGKASGLMTTAFHTGFFVGPPLGGLIIDYINWRGIFFFLVPIGLVGIALTYMRFALSREPETVLRSVRIDYLGVALFVTSTVTLTLLLDRRAAEVTGLEHRGFLTFALGGALLGFLVHEYRAPSPIMNLHLFKIRMFAHSVVSVLLLHIIHGLVDFILPFYIQEVLQLSPSLMGLMFLAPPVFTITLATVSGHITDKVGPRVPATIGVLATIAALFIGANLRIDSLWILPTVMLGLRGISTAFFSSPNHAALVGSVPIEDRGFATGMLHTVVGLGNLVGISLGGALLTLGFQYYSGNLGAAPNPDNPFAFVSAMNVNYLIGMGVGVIALLASLMRGGAKIQPHPGVGE